MAKTIYQDSSWDLGSIQDARDSGHLKMTGDLDDARGFWAEVLHDSDHVEVFDRILEITAEYPLKAAGAVR